MRNQTAFIPDIIDSELPPCEDVSPNRATPQPEGQAESPAPAVLTSQGHSNEVSLRASCPLSPLVDRPYSASWSRREQWGQATQIEKTPGGHQSVTRNCGANWSWASGASSYGDWRGPKRQPGSHLFDSTTFPKMGDSQRTWSWEQLGDWGRGGKGGLYRGLPP